MRVICGQVNELKTEDSVSQVRYDVLVATNRENLLSIQGHHKSLQPNASRQGNHGEFLHVTFLISICVVGN